MSEPTATAEPYGASLKRMRESITAALADASLDAATKLQLLATKLGLLYELLEDREADLAYEHSRRVAAERRADELLNIARKLLSQIERLSSK